MRDAEGRARLADGAGDAREDAYRIIVGFLGNRPAAVATVTAWARPVAEHHAWGFEAPDDIVQEVLLALVQNFRAKRFVGGNLRAYVRRITKNLCISSYRRARSRGISVPLEDDSLPSSPRGEAAAERSAALKRILESLDEPCRRMIVLAYLHGVSRREIARRLGISEGAAKVRLFRCLERARGMQDRAPSLNSEGTVHRGDVEQ